MSTTQDKLLAYAAILEFLRANGPATIDLIAAATGEPARTVAMRLVSLRKQDKAYAETRRMSPGVYVRWYGAVARQG